jgi:hypothetical protein
MIGYTVELAVLFVRVLFAVVLVEVVVFTLVVLEDVVLVVFEARTLSLGNLGVWGIWGIWHWHLLVGILLVVVTLLQSVHEHVVIFYVELAEPPTVTLHVHCWFWGTMGWLQLHCLNPFLLMGSCLSVQQQSRISSNIILFLVMMLVVLTCFVQLQVKEAFPLIIVSAQRQPIISAAGRASLWHWVRGGLGRQHVQFWLLIPSTLVWLRHEHCWLTTTGRDDGWLGQSQTSTKAFLVELNCCLHVHLWIEDWGELHDGYWTFTVRFLETQHEQDCVVLFPAITWMHEQSDVFCANFEKLY